MLLVTIGRIAQFALLLLTLRLATSLLSPAEMGKISIVTATVAFFAMLMLNPVGMFMNRRLHAWDLRGQAIGYLTYFWRYLIVVNLFSALVLIGITGLNIWNPSISIYWLLLLVCGNLIFGTVNQVVIPGLNLLGHRGWFTVLTVATAATSLIFAVVLARAVLPNAEYWLSGLLIGQLIVGLIGKKIFFERLQRANSGSNTLPKLSHSHIQNLRRFAWPVAIAVGLGWIQSQGYRYLMEERLGLIELGLFVSGYSISAGIIAAFESVLTTYFQPQFYKRINTNDLVERTAAWNEYASALFPALLVTVFFIGGLSKELSRTLLGPAFQTASAFVLWGAFAEAARVLAGAYSLVAHAQMKTRLLLLPNAIGAILAVGLGVAFIPSLGGAGAGAALVVSSVAIVAVMNWQMRKHMAIKLPVKRLAISALGGGVLLVTAKSIERLLAYGDGILVSLSILGAVSVIYLIVQYWLIVPVLRLTSERA